MSAHVNDDRGTAVPRPLVDVGPASAPPKPRPAADSHITFRRAAEGGAAPVATPDQGAPAPAHAGVVTRLLAAALDAVVVVVLTALLDLAAAGARFLWSPADFRWPRPTAVVTVSVLLLVAVVYLAIGWALTGRTYGSRLMGLRVLSSQYRQLGWTRSILRALISVIWPIGLLWCGISRTRLSLSDVVLRTVVVYDTQLYSPARGRLS
jgi:uncharacterized RDD family membrane protein YckC